MSDYLSRLIAENVHSVSIARGLDKAVSQYNLEVLSVVGDDNLRFLPSMDSDSFMDDCHILRNELVPFGLESLADSVLYSYSAYMLTSLELEEVYFSDFIDTRTWYFDRLQTKYNILSSHIDSMTGAIYNDLRQNSEDFEKGYYRSIALGIVAVAIGFLLILMFLLFVLTYYVSPLNKMLAGMNNYRTYNRKYTYTFDGDDQLIELNEGISGLISDNQQLRKRIQSVKRENQSGNESI